MQLSCGHRLKLRCRILVRANSNVATKGAFPGDLKHAESLFLWAIGAEPPILIPDPCRRLRLTPGAMLNMRVIRALKASTVQALEHSARRIFGFSEL